MVQNQRRVAVTILAASSMASGTDFPQDQCLTAATKKSCSMMGSNLGCNWCHSFCAKDCLASLVPSGLAVAIQEVVDRPEYDGCKWGIQARVVNNTRLIYENGGAHRFSVPASNNKVPTTLAAWLALGPDYAFETSLGIISHGDGIFNVTICGANDPSLTSAQLQTAAGDLVAAHPELKSATTVNVRADDRRGSDSLFPPSWEWEDLQAYYGAPPSSVILDGNVVTVQLTPGGTAGDAAFVTVLGAGGSAEDGAGECFGVDNRARTVASAAAVVAPPACSFATEAGAFDLVLTGDVAADAATPWAATVACRDPLRRSASGLAAALGVLGVQGAAAAPTVAGSAECDPVNWPATLGAVATSDRLEVLINHTLLVSDNTWDRFHPLTTCEGPLNSPDSLYFKEIF
jgi:PBP4 family serine-type D-alanyl-D-alanine carboxypeptidase